MVVFACQNDSFLKEFSSKVISCSTAEFKTVVNGKKETLKGYDVILEDTILFPEGGGQPCDYGFLGDIPVLNVRRNGSEAVHFVEKPLEPGLAVKQIINWDRRLDHMQQHSGQHLITAIADAEFGYGTTSWWLGEEISHLELDTQEITEEQINKLEYLVNEKIRQSVPVDVTVYEENDPFLSETRTRGLPKDHVGSVRIVTIQGIESNMCCGTHVSNLSQLQAIKLMGAEKGKKGKVNLMFLAGGRVLKRLSVMLEREQALTGILNNGPDVHVSLVDKLMKSVKLSNKNLQNVLRDMAVAEANILKSKEPKPNFYTLHRKDGEMDFINAFIKAVNDTNILLFLTIGDEKEVGYAVLYGNEKLVAEFGPKITELMSGKGNGKGNRYQARVANMSKRSMVISLIEEALGPT
ncbi:alanyl-tRNA editing protein Aarsd1-A [Halyomorpha halys]|uniref:alanyl-tRNA editing protein Aarsd1-A n=1 Tax=Halyomorpha halys TaxID=286706 RepID=UPI0006D4FB06|nr:alanyl-tRNA editing protein Aarsd1-A [Halyomorpha halys]